MNIHEYQAKKLLAKYGINIPKGAIAYTANEAKKVISSVSLRGPWVLKAQIQSGNRNRGYFLEKKAGKKGGIRKIKSRRDIIDTAQRMLGSTLVTSQTGPKGKFVSKIYVEAFCKVKQIFYAGLAIDRLDASLMLLIASTPDGEISEYALKHPDKILRIRLSLKDKVDSEQIYAILNFLKLDEKSYKSLENFINGLHQFFLENDATMIEINPVGIQGNGSLVALDAKVSFDDNALFRQKAIEILQDDYELDDRALTAAKYNFRYNEFDSGSVGCIVNGDGVAMAVMDSLQNKNSGTACFLNVKGGVDKDKIAAGIKIIMTNPKVEGIFINILGGFLRCNLIADGIIAAASEVGLNVPLVVRFEGTNKEDASEILEHSKLPIIIAQDMEDGIEKLLQAMKESE